MKKRRLIHLISSLKRGGAESLLVDLLKHLDEFEHFVIYFHDGPNRQRLEEQGVVTYQVNGLICLYDPVFWIRLWRLIRSIQPDIIHSTLWAANFAGRLLAKVLEIPLVSVIHLGDHRQDGKLRNAIDWATFRFSGTVVAVSEEIRNALRLRNWIPANRICTILNGVDAGTVQAHSQRKNISRSNLGLLSDHFVIGAVGRFHYRKNFPLLIFAFAQLSKQYDFARLVLIGFGPQEQELRSLAQKYGVGHKIVFVVGQPAYSYYPLFDCFVQSSFQEGISIALLEAMCFSLPCLVTSPIESHEVLVDDNNGLIVPSNDLDLLIEKLSLLVSDHALRQRLGLNAYKTVTDKFSMDRMAAQYKNILLR